MKPTDKAAYFLARYLSQGLTQEQAKQCAIICVEEIIKTNTDTSKHGKAFNKYYEEVREILNKL